MKRTDVLTRVARVAERSPSGFPLLAWVRCECGCGEEGVDEVTQWLIEEAAMIALDVGRRNRARQDAEQDDAGARMMDLAYQTLAKARGR